MKGRLPATDPEWFTASRWGQVGGTVSGHDENGAASGQVDPTETGDSGAAPTVEPSAVTDGPAADELHEQDGPATVEATREDEIRVEPGDDLRALVDEIASLSAQFDKRASEYERTIRELYSRVEELQRNQLMGLMKPVFVQFADLHAEMVSTAQQAREAGDEGHASDLDYFTEAFERMLGHFDLESVGAAAGGPFDRRSQAAVLTKKTTDRAADQTVARVVRQGFRMSGEERVLIPARVVVWKAVDPSVPEAVPNDRQATPADAVSPIQNTTERNDGDLS